MRDKRKAEALQKEYEDAVNQAKIDIVHAFMDMEASLELIKLSKISLIAASESYAMANKRYSANTGTITELLDAQNLLTQAELGVSQAMAEYQNARSRLFFYVGIENFNLQ